MPTERLEWLELRPEAPAAKKTIEAGQPPCPTCGWPNEDHAKTCAHCGYSMRTGPSTNLMADLKLTLPSPVIEMKAAPEHWFVARAADTPTMYMLRLQAERLHVTAGFASPGPVWFPLM